MYFLKSLCRCQQENLPDIEEEICCLKFRGKQDVFARSNLHTETTTMKQVGGGDDVYINQPHYISHYNRYIDVLT